MMPRSRLPISRVGIQPRECGSWANRQYALREQGPQWRSVAPSSGSAGAVRVRLPTLEGFWQLGNRRSCLCSSADSRRTAPIERSKVDARMNHPVFHRLELATTFAAADRGTTPTHRGSVDKYNQRQFGYPEGVDQGDVHVWVFATPSGQSAPYGISRRSPLAPGLS